MHLVLFPIQSSQLLHSSILLADGSSHPIDASSDVVKSSSATESSQQQ